MSSAVYLHSGQNQGSKSHLIRIEACFARGFSGIQLLGNIGDLGRENLERAKTSLENLGLKLSQKRIIISLSPAQLRKEGNHLDLPLAVAILALHLDRDLPPHFKESIFLGEVNLAGEILATRNAVPLIAKAIQSGLQSAFVSHLQLEELACLSSLCRKHHFKIYPLSNLSEMTEVMRSGQLPDAPSIDPIHDSAVTVDDLKPLDFSDMQLTADQKQLALCCSLGRHNILLFGPPGTGKSMFAKRLPSLAPFLSSRQQLEVIENHACSNDQIDQRIFRSHPPVRIPHHAASAASIIGTPQRAGEVSLAHHGHLILDEFAEFRRDIIEQLREPLESSVIHVARAEKSTSWQAQFQLIATANLCPCGWYGSKRRLCRCNSSKLLAYQRKLSGPVLDRIALKTSFPEEQNLAFHSDPSSRKQQTEELTETLHEARRFRLNRMKTDQQPHQSAQGLASLPEVIEKSMICESGHSLLTKILKEDALSSRSMVHLIEVSRTLADLATSEMVRTEHIQQAKNWQQKPF